MTRDSGDYNGTLGDLYEDEFDFILSISEYYFDRGQMRKGWIALHYIGVIYLSIASIILSYNFLVPSVLIIAKKLKLKQDVAGALLFGGSTSLMEMVYRAIGVFVWKHDVPLEWSQWLVGQTYFNILILGAIAGFASPSRITLAKYPIFRDLLFYVVSVLVLLVVTLYGIAWYGAFILLLVSGGYFTILLLGRRIEPMLMGFFKDPETNEEEDDKNEEEEVPISFPKNNIAESIWFIITIPALIPFYLTLPDVNNNKFTILPSFKVPGKILYVWTFLGSLIWMFVLSWTMIYLSWPIGWTIGIPNEVMDIWWTYFGVSMPIIVAIVLAVRKGKGNMALSTIFGRIIFQITIIKPLPWMLSCLIHGPIRYGVNENYCSLIYLVFVFIAFTLTMLGFRFRLTKLFGIPLLLVYIIFIPIFILNVYAYIECLI